MMHGPPESAVYIQRAAAPVTGGESPADSFVQSRSEGYQEIDCNYVEYLHKTRGHTRRHGTRSVHQSFAG